MAFLAKLAVVALVLLLLGKFFRYSDQEIGKQATLSYSCFFIGGATIAIFHMMMAVSGDEPYMPYVGLALIQLVAILSVIGLIASLPILRKEKPLVVIIGLTIVLAVLQYASIMTDRFFVDHLMNWYARFYALVCLAAPVVAIIKASRKPGKQHRIEE